MHLNPFFVRGSFCAHLIVWKTLPCTFCIVFPLAGENLDFQPALENFLPSLIRWGHIDIWTKTGWHKCQDEKRAAEVSTEVWQSVIKNDTFKFGKAGGQNSIKQPFTTYQPTNKLLNKQYWDSQSYLPKPINFPTDSICVVTFSCCKTSKWHPHTSPYHLISQSWLTWAANIWPPGSAHPPNKQQAYF